MRWSQRGVVKGKEKIPLDQPVIYTPNHAGAFDIPAIVLTTPAPPMFMAKKELRKLPMINEWMDVVDCIFVDRNNKNTAHSSLQDAIDKVNAETIFVLPNNKNIILAANQAAELTTDKNILVIPTKTIPQGITAVINYVSELSVDENEENMMSEIGNVKTGQVTYAVRDTMIDDKEIHEGDYMGIGDKGMLAVGQDMEAVTVEMVAEMVDEDSELISVYYGCDVDESAAEELVEKLEEAYPDCDIELQMGGQPIYYYVISVE